MSLGINCSTLFILPELVGFKFCGMPAESHILCAILGINTKDIFYRHFGSRSELAELLRISARYENGLETQELSAITR